MKFFAIAAIAATASAVKLNEASQASASTELQAQADLENWSEQLAQIQSRIGDRIESRTHAGIEARMDALEKDMFDLGAAINQGKNLWHQYGQPLWKKYVH